MTRRTLAFWGAALTVLLAFLLRTPTLDLQSFWMDEVQAFEFIDHPFTETVRLILSPEENGPLHFLLLWFWQRLTGPSDFAVRYLSDLCSVLTVAVLWRLADAWFGRRVAHLSAGLLAVSPFAIWYAQDAKMYALHMLLAASSTFLLVRATRRSAGVRKRAWSLWLAYGVVLNLLGYSHFFGAFTIAAQGIAVVVTHLYRPRVIRTYLLTMAIVALPYIPVVSFALRLLPNFQIQDISKGFVTLPHMIQDLAAEYVLKVSRTYVARMSPLLVTTAAVIALGCYRAWRIAWRKAVWVLGLLILPAAIFYPISFRVPVFSPKYLSASFLMLVLCAALAIDQLATWRRALGWVGLAAAIAFNGWANGRILTDPSLQRGDWRAATAYIEAHMRPDDAIIGFADYIHRAIYRYYDGEAPVYRFKGDAYDPEPFFRNVLQRDQDHHTLWLVLHHDQAMAPHNRLRETAGLLYPQITGIYPNNGRIAVLGFNVRWRHEKLPATATPLDAAFHNGLELRGFEVDADELVPYDAAFHPPSNWIHVTTYWKRSAGGADDDFTPFLHLVGAEGGVWGGELLRPPTVFHRDPPSGWDREGLVEAHYDVNLNPVTPPGTYHLVLGLAHGDGSIITTTTGLPEVELTEITIIE